MSYFQEMYQAAINHDDQTIKTLLSTGACIDERELNERSTTVAGKLAAEGKVDVAKYLINNFGAGPEYVAHGCLHAGNKTEAEEIIKKFNVDTSIVFFTQLKRGQSYFNYIEQLKNENSQRRLEALAHAGHVKKVKEILETDIAIEMYATHQYIPHEKMLTKNILKFLGFGGHIGYLEQEFAQRKKLPKDIGYEIMGFHGIGGLGYNSMRFSNGKLALHTLSFIQNDKFRDYLVKEIKQNGYVSYLNPNFIYDIDEIAKQSQKINTLMQDYELDYEHALYCSDKPNFAQAIKTAQLMQVYQIKEEQAKQWLTDPGFRTWFRKYHQFKSDNRIFPPEIIKSIDEYLLHDNLKEVNEFLDKTKKPQNEKLKSLYASNFFRKPALSSPEEHIVRHNAQNKTLLST